MLFLGVRTTRKWPRGQLGLALDAVSLEETDKRFHLQTRVPDYGAKRASIELTMVRHNNLGKRLIAPKKQMAAFATDHHEPRSFKRGDAYLA